MTVPAAHYSDSYGGEQIVRCMANELDIGHRRKGLKDPFLPARSVATRYIN